MTGPLKLNRSYNFVDKHSIVDEIRTAIYDSGEPIEHIARSAGVCRATIDCWLHGKTRKPYSTSVEKVARALGKRLSLTDNGDLQLVDHAPPPLPPAKRREPIIAWNWRRDH